MSATVLTQPEAQQQDQALRTDFSTSCAELQRDVDAFKVKVQRKAAAREEIRMGLVAEAADLVAAGGDIRAAFEKSPWPERIRTANWLHKALTAGRNLVFAPIEEAEGIHSRLSRDMKLQEDRKVLAQKQKIEDEMRRQQKEARQLEVDGLKADGREEEAAIREVAPLPPVMAPPPKPAAPIPGVKSVSAWAELDGIVDPAKLCAWLAQNPTMLLELFDADHTGWKRLLTNHYDHTGPRPTYSMSLNTDAMGIKWKPGGTVRKARNGNDQA